MPVYEFKGEDFLAALGCERADAQEFCGVVVYRFWGTETQIKGATDVLTARYPLCAVTSLGDAQWLGKIRAGVTPIKGERPIYDDLYELIVMRKLDHGK